MTAYQQLERRFARLAHLDAAQGLLDWDQQTMMPDGAAESRAEVRATLNLIGHELITDRQLADWLDEAETDGTLDDWPRANLEAMRRRWRHANAVPADLVEASSRAISKCEMIWRTARRDNDFAALRPSLQTVLDLQRQIAACKAEALGVSPYDALLDSFEPEGRSAAIDGLFDELADFLPETVAAVLERQARGPDVARPQGPFPVERQRELGTRLMQAVGFDFQRGRLDVSLHPFCGGADNDVRITTRYDEADFVKALMGVLHETGHALYEQGRPADWLHQPVGAALGMSLHESQSLIVEMQACRSREFLDFAAPLLRETFGGDGPAWQADNLHRLYTTVELGFIRVDADEVTYPAHVILRYRLERAMIAGDLALADLPGAWNDGMAELLGVVPPTDALGCLQDIHWPGGAWGYFPTYTMGAMTAAQLFEAAGAAEPDVLPGIARGDFEPMVGWLRRNVHGHGSRLSADELLTQATGRPLDTAAFKRHLTRRYLDG
ncbi:MAG: carboxypeptidase M32 [Inquilinus sp.]|nr:carboxypeptidase M32 [Inquilinus sp.]